MERIIYNQLLKWKQSPHRKPLILQGARQVGKTFSAIEFGNRYYKNVIYFNFEADETLKELFVDITSEKLVLRLQHHSRQTIFKHDTLIIFDEIQHCERALTSLKYFNETANDYHIIALGSLLGVAVNRESYSFPVGKVQFLTMYPMDFFEFLKAYGEDFLIEEIKSSFNNNKELPQHTRALELFYEYLAIGGMPSVVKSYIQHKDIILARSQQSDIIQAYLNDMGKYNKKAEIPKTRLLFLNALTQLAKENTKFQYKYIKSGGRAREFEEAVQWLALSGIATPVYRLTQVAQPLNAHRSDSDFKFYLNDTGLLLASQNVNPQSVIYMDSSLNSFKGGLMENYVSNQLQVLGFERFYWTSEGTAEVDFVYESLKHGVIPLEVKSSHNTKSKSLNVYISRYEPKLPIRISTKNFGLEGGIKSVPLYAIFCLD